MLLFFFFFCCFCVFFQAEDGIRDLVRSRGLGDVYKRQVRSDVSIAFLITVAAVQFGYAAYAGLEVSVPIGKPVSYTHLTLPTSDLV